MQGATNYLITFLMDVMEVLAPYYKGQRASLVISEMLVAFKE